MNYLKQNHLSVIILVILAIAFFMPKGTGMLGALDRTTVTNPWTFNESITVSTADITSTGGSTTLATTTITNLTNLANGGPSIATTTNDAGTFTAAQVCDNNLIVATPNVGAVTLTFPTSAQLFADCLGTVGMEKKIRLKNATTTTGAASILTLADGANGDHQEQEGETTLVEGTEWAEITFLNIDGTNHMMLVTVTQVAD